MIFATYRDLFTAIAGTSGALTGLLFVAMSVAPRRERAVGALVIRGFRVAAALLAFTNAMGVSLYSLVPGTRVGYPSLAFGVVGIAFTAAAIRSIFVSDSSVRQKLQQVGLILLLLVIFGTEFVSGIAMVRSPGSVGWLQAIGYALVSSLIVGIARAWELVGERGTGIGSSLATLLGHESDAEFAEASEEPADADNTDGGGAGPSRGQPGA